MNQHTTQAEGILSLAKEVLKIESAAVSALSDRIGDDFVRAVQALLACRGRVVVTGIGKSGPYCPQDCGHNGFHRDPRFLCSCRRSIAW